MKRSFAFVLLALVLADAIAFVPGARAAPSQVIFATTAAFDGGTKASVGTATDTCENVTANALQLNNTGNYQGIGLTTGKATCATGAWGVSASSLGFSFDMQRASSSSLTDYSGNGRTATSGNHFSGSTAGTPATAKFGGGQQNVWGGSWTPSSKPIQTSTLFVGAWASFGNFTGGGGWPLGTVVISREQFSVNNQDWMLYVNNTGHVCFEVAEWATRYLACGASTLLTGVEYMIGGTRSGTAVKAYLNGNPDGTTTTNNSAFTPSTASIEIGAVDSGSGGWGSSKIDEIVYLGRVPSAAEILAWGTDGRSQFLSSGSWQSPSQTLTSAPTLATITFSGGTSTNRPSRLRVFSSQSGPVVFDKLIPSGLTSPVQIPLNLTFFPPTWSVKLDMVGNGSASAFVSSIVLSLANQSLLQSSDMIFIMFLILMIGLGLAGFALDFPVLTIIGGISGFMFGWWLFLQTNNVILAILMWGVGSVFMLVGVIMALLYEGGTSA